MPASGERLGGALRLEPANASGGVGLRVAVLSPPWYPVPPTAYGGTEHVVHLLVEGLVARGVDVTLFAAGDSRTSAELEFVYPSAPSERIGEAMWELAHVLLGAERAGEFDLVHDHSGVLGLALVAATGARVVHTVHGPLGDFESALYERACLHARGPVWLTSLSRSQRGVHASLPWLANVPNGIDLSRYPLRSSRDGNYLLFLGRMCPEKGAHRAIEVARASGLPLKIAAKCRERAERRFFAEHVEPALGNGIEYVGEATFEEKIDLLHGARATLAPIEWDEPFGLVLVESAACGTPVVATRRGSVPEVVADGVTGVIVDDHSEMAAALDRACGLDPAAMRADVEARFGAELMVERYLDVYERAMRLARPRGRRPEVGRPYAVSPVQGAVADGRSRQATVHRL